jgi:O-antigen/teichoic acid export membrane protein
MMSVALSAVPRLRRSAVLHSTVVNFAIVGIAMIAGILVARSLGADGRGYYAAVMAWFALTQVVGELGQSGAVTYWVSRDPANGRHYVASSRLLMLGGGGVFCIVGFFLSRTLAGGEPSVTLAYQIAFAGCLLNSLCAAFVYAIQAVSIGRWNVVRLSQPVSYLVLVAALMLTSVLDIVWLSIALIASIAIQFVVAIIQGVAVGIGGGRPRRLLISELFRFGLAYAGSAVPASLSMQYDKLVLSRLALPSHLGQYAVASTVASLASPISTAVASVVFPRSARGWLAEGDRRRIESRSVLGTAAASAGVSLLIALAVAPLIPFIFGVEFQNAVGLVWWLTPAMFFRSVSQVISALLRGRQRPGLATYGQLSGLAIGALAIFPLVAWLGIEGAALSSAIGEFVALAIGSTALIRVRRTVSIQLQTGVDPVESSEAFGSAISDASDARGSGN